MKTSTWLRAGVIAAAVAICASPTHAQGDELLVTNVQAQQRPFSALVDITYDLETIDDIAVMVRLFLSTDAGTSYPYLCQTVSGDVGPGVLPGTNRHIVWDAGADFPGFSSPTCRLRVTADDGANLDDYVYVTPGVFTMGSPTDEPGRTDSELQHQVTLTQGIYVQTTEVTNQQYMELAQWAYDQGYAMATSDILRDNLDGSTEMLRILGAENYEISFSNGVFSCVNPDHPVKYVTWYGSVAYCDWLSLQQGLPRAYSHATWECNGGDPYTAAGYRLPTEAEWEYACRAGSTTAFANGPITFPYVCSPLDPNLDSMGWYCGNAGGWTHPVAQKLPNAWALYDMHGNVYEWCNDWCCDDYGGEVTDPVGPGAGSSRVWRGGSRHATAEYCRSAARNFSFPNFAGSWAGFRPVRSSDAGSGIAIVDVEPESLNAPWQIEGPYGYAYSGSGDATLTGLLPGEYTVTWGAVDGWIEPPAETQFLGENGTLTFNAVYIEDTGPAGFVHVLPGTFAMGSPTDEPGRDGDETQHQVTLTHGIYVQVTEVTNQQYVELAQWAYDQGHATMDGVLLRDNLDGSTAVLIDLDAGSFELFFSNGVFSCINPDHPVKDVTWYGSATYCDWLSLQQDLPRAYDHATWQCNGGNPYTAAGYRLPTEAEWEYACRAGSTTAFANGPITQLNCTPIDPNLDVMGWYCGNAETWSRPVAQKLPNVWGLYDMHGDLWEWCNDWYAQYGGAVTDPAGPGAGSVRVIRGGYWNNHAKNCRSAYRFYNIPSVSSRGIGFRPVRSVS